MPHKHPLPEDLRDTAKAYHDDAKAELPWRIGAAILVIGLLIIAAMFGYLTIRSIF